MAKKRDYKAEYERRNQESQRKYGVSYNQQRSLIGKGKDAGYKPNETRSLLRKRLTSPKAANLDIRDFFAKAQRARDDYAEYGYTDAGHDFQDEFGDLIDDEKLLHYHP